MSTTTNQCVYNEKYYKGIFNLLNFANYNIALYFHFTFPFPKQSYLAGSMQKLSPFITSMHLRNSYYIAQDSLIKLTKNNTTLNWTDYDIYYKTDIDLSVHGFSMSKLMPICNNCAGHL